MCNGIFALNYFNAEGTKALTDYWEQMFARDPELLMLMMANPGNYFEDSIELISVASYWTSSFLDDMPDGYAYSDILPTVAASKYVSSGFMGVTLPTTSSSQATTAWPTASMRTTVSGWLNSMSSIALPASASGRRRP